MNEFEQKMYDKYPVMLKGLTMSAQESCLSWGFECGEGWHPILEEMFDKLGALDEDVDIGQVKEKLGGLRVYYMGVSDNVAKIIKEAETKCETTCEVCGKEGTLNTKGWYSVRCDEHK
jgi:hypothetical protein